MTSKGDIKGSKHIITELAVTLVVPYTWVGCTGNDIWTQEGAGAGSRNGE